MALYEEVDGKIVPFIGDLSDEAMRYIERADDEAIVQRMTTGLGADAFIYHFAIQTNTGPKDVVGISSSGADEMAKMLGNLESLNDVRLDKDSDPDYIYAMVRVKDLIRNVTLLGVGRQCKYQVGKGNAPDHARMDEHAFVKAITKGQRNGILHHVSEDIVLKIINTFKTQGKERRIAPPKLETEETRPAVRTPPAQAPKPAAAPVAKPVVAVQSTVVAEAPVTQTDTEKLAAQVAAQQEKLKNLRVNVHNRFQTDLGINQDKRREILKKEIGIESLTEMNEEQLNKALDIANNMVNERIEKMNADIEARKKAPAAAPIVQEDKKEVITPEDTRPVYVVLGYESQDEQDRLRGRLYTLLTAPEQLALKPEEAKKYITDRNFASAAVIPKDKFNAIIAEVTDIIEAKKTPSNF